MLATLIVVFREAIEAGLIVGIVLAATRGVPGRTRQVVLGVGAGVAGACVVAAFAGSIADAFAGSGQEMFNAGILSLAVLMLGWHSIWMAQHGRELAAEMRSIGSSVAHGHRPVTALIAVVGVAVLREGAEVVLFLYGIAASGDTGWAGMLGGGALGILLGAALSVVTYAGLVRLPVRRLFAATGALITLLAAGLASQVAALLQDGGVTDALGATMWDTSDILSDRSLLGRVLHTLIGYTDRPTGLQVVTYMATLAAIVLLGRVFAPPARPPVLSSARPTVVGG